MKKVVFLFGGLLLSGCSLGSITIKIRPDLSGTVVFREVSVAEMEPGEGPKIQGATAKNWAEFKVRVWEYEFHRLSDLSVGGITFQASADDLKILVDMTVPIDPAADWFRDLQVDEVKLRKVEEFAKRNMGTRESIPLLLGAENPPQIGITIEFPGEVRLKRADPAVDASFPLLGTGTGSEAEKDRQVTLNLAVNDVLKKRADKIVVHVEAARCPGAGLARATAVVEPSKRKKPSAERPKAQTKKPRPVKGASKKSANSRALKTQSA